MLLNVHSRTCQRLVRQQRRRIRTLPFLRSSSPWVQPRGGQSRNLASNTRQKQFAKATSYKSKVASYETLGGKLAQRRGPTLLYQSQSNFPYIFGCYVVGGGLIGCGIINNFTKNMANARVDLPAYVPVFVAVGQFFIIAFGGWMCLKSQNLIKSIKAIPSTEPGSRSVLLQIERSRSVPFIKPRTYTVPPRDITMSSPLFLGGDEQIMAELKELQRQEARQLAFDKGSSPRTLPFRVLGYWTTVLFGGVRKAFANEGLINFHVRGNNFAWKMETQMAWALEHGRTLDRLVRIREH